MKDKLHLPFEYHVINSEDLEIFTLNELINTLDFIGVFLCTNGHIEGNIDSIRYSISKGDLFFYTPSLYVRILDRSPDFNGIVIQSGYDYVIPLINKVIDVKTQLTFRTNPCISLSQKQFDDVYQLMVSLKNRIDLESTSSTDSQRENILRELIMSLGATLMYEIVNIYFTNNPKSSAPIDRGDTILQKFIISLYQHYYTEHDVAFYANELCLSPSYLSSVIKKKTGKSSLQWIVEMIIIDAKQMLQYSNYSIKEISTRLNFSTQSFFGKYFKQYVGISPKDYRNRWSKNK